MYVWSNFDISKQFECMQTMWAKCQMHHCLILHSLSGGITKWFPLCLLALCMSGVQLDPTLFIDAMYVWGPVGPHSVN